MKSIFLFCTKLRFYLTELPVIILLAIALRCNESSTEPLKLYPLITVLSLAIVFIAVYFFRAITLTHEEIRYHGLFSSKDSALITKDKTLRITVLGKRRLRLELFGDAGESPAFEWMRQEDVVHREICLFRGKAIGGMGTVSRILRNFGMESELDPTALGVLFEDDDVIISSEGSDSAGCYGIKFKRTIL